MMQEYERSTKYHSYLLPQILMWLFFVIQVCFLCLLLIIAYLVPVVPGHPWAKLPQDALFAGLSAMMALLSGSLFVRNSGRTLSFGSLISTPPCVVGITVITLVAIPLLIGFLTSKGKL